MSNRLGNRRATLVLSALVLLFFRHASLTGADHPSAPRKVPKLIVALTIDQFRYDYLVRFRPYFTQGGFNLLLKGAVFVDCRYDYATTITCPGHATLFTGAYSNIHGIIGNDWYDRSLGRRVYCVEDAKEKPVGSSAGAGFSPRKLVGTTIGDELRMATDFKSRVVSVSLKDRAAVIPGGHLANAAYWYDVATGRFVSSTYYMQDLPAWASAFNQSFPARSHCDKPWRALPETPHVGSQVLSQFRSDAKEPCPGGKFLAWLNSTPYMSEIELRFAAQAVKSERLGHGPATDLLAVSLSVNDYIGHGFGPYSDQVADATLRTDRYLAEFFRAVDQTVGLDNVWITLSADHGASPTPRYIREHRLSDERPFPSAVRGAIEHGLSEAFGEGSWIQDLGEFYVNLNPSTLNRYHVDADKAAAIAAESASTVPGVREVFTRRQFLTGTLPLNAIARKAARSFNTQRSGDIFIVLDSFASAVSDETKTSHGAPWSYDAQVPLIFWGDGFRPGIYPAAVEPIDLAPTLAAALGINQPSGAEGHPLIEILK